jgi:hypothetical protein
MANFTRNFIAGRMNKTFDERVIPDGEYIDAMNIRMGSTEKSEAGVIENTKGNLPLTTLTYIDGTPLSNDARCIGAIDDSANETLYWFVHDPAFASSPTGKLDLIVSYNTTSQVLTYHVVSVNDGNGINTTLNFNPQYLITGVNIIENLLFFTDDYNQPRFINVTRNYDNPDVTFVDNNGLPDLLAEALLVIKKPPTESPTISLLELAGQENFLEERFICFAYRYKYADGEYSATSQWTEPAFFPKTFIFSEDSFLNEGMTNRYNGVDVSFNTGGPLVVGIDLLFKEATSNVIKVIEKFDKQVVGWTDNTIQTYQFSNSKIFTILPESELLRLYDNVPRLAKAQTIMGNRLMYGNHVDGYDLIDSNGFPVNFNYEAELIATELKSTDLSTSLSNGTYNIELPLTVPDSILNIDLTGIPLNQDSILTLNVTLVGVDNSLVEINSTSTFPFEDTQVSFSFYFNKDYSSVYELATSQEFIDFIGTASNIQPVYPSPCNGITFTDIVNCENYCCWYVGPLSPGLLPRVKVAAGINAVSEPISIITSPSSDVIGFQFLAVEYKQLPLPALLSYYAYYKITSREAKIKFGNESKSLHSNRDYEIGIVYMDEFNRATPANVSQLNTVHVPCGNSDLKNSITVTIPPSQIAPYWAKRYKFVCKADQHIYETIYSNTWFTNTSDQQTYFLLQGENARKVEDGDRFIVKADTNGPTASCIYATVLEKQSYASGTIQATPPNPAGVYMKINANDFNVNKSPDAVIAPGRIEKIERDANEGPILIYPMNLEISPGVFQDYSVPAGSVIVFDIFFQRVGTGNACEKREYTLKKTYVSSNNYTSMEEWFNGDNIASTLNDGIQNIGNNQCLANNIYIPTTGTLSTYSLCNNYWQFGRNGISQELILQISGTTACSGTGRDRDSLVSANIVVYRAIDSIIFETEPIDTLPDVFFENNLSFPVDKNGNHLSNGAVGDTSQDIGAGISGVIQTDFFNCFTFGNGAESYKIRDSIVGRDFNLGNRVTTVAAQDYREERRFADITYSGVYNPETNVNKLNEFNYALLNYKNLELSFGAVYILDGRETDVLVLQEDKVSYVLAGKNLLSDAAAGGAITSVPEVLGTQIARTEKYGISFNPESYVQWGYDRFFTDAKRGAVLQLKGNAYSNEQLTVISEQNMRTWFRDEFIQSFNTQKLGGFDPYMNEYVLSINDIQIPEDKECIKCGTTQTLTFAQGEGISATYNFCSEFGNDLGKVVIDWNVMSIDPTTEFEVDAVFDGNLYQSGVQTSSGSISFFKLVSTPTATDVQISVTGNVVLIITVRCPDREPITLVEVVLTLDSDAGKTMMNQFNYVNGVYTSPTQNRFYIFGSGTGNPLVTLYNVTSGFVGQGNLPPEGATMRLQTNETQPYVTFDFDPAFNKFRYARTSVLYGNNNVDMQALLAVSSEATPIVSPSTGIHYADFTVPLSTNGQYLYIIWDLRKSTEVQMCYGATLDDVCCDCEPCTELCSYYIFSNPASATVDAIVEYPIGTCFDPTLFTQTILPGETFGFCLKNDVNKYTVLQGNPTVYMDSCFC